MADAFNIHQDSRVNRLHKFWHPSSSFREQASIFKPRFAHSITYYGGLNLNDPCAYCVARQLLQKAPDMLDDVKLQYSTLCSICAP